MADRRRKQQTTNHIHPMGAEDIEGAAYVCDGALSPDARLAAYVLSETLGKPERRKQASSIWLVSTAGGTPKRLTRQGGSDTNPVFSADGKSVYFLAKRDHVAQVYRIPVDGGEAEQVTSLPQGAGPFRLSNDGKQLAFATVAEAHSGNASDNHVRVDRDWYHFDPVGGYLDHVNQAVYLLELSKKDAEPIAITEHAGVILNFAFSPLGRRIAFVRMGARHHKFGQADLCLATFGRRGREAEETLVRNSIIGDLAFGTDGEEILYTGAKGLADQASLWRTSTTGDKPRNVTARHGWMVGGGLQIHSPARGVSRICPLDERRTCLAITEGGELHIHKIATRGRSKPRQLTHGPRVCQLFDVAAGKLLFASQDLNHPPALRLMDLETGGETELTHHNKAWHEKFRWPVREHVTFKSGGDALEGWVLKPRHVRPPYKTILCIHGGPHAGFGESFNFDFHQLVGAGYAVAFANPHGSTGYGNAFAKSIIGRWGDLELKDFNVFLDELVKRRIAHPRKLGITGISGGGHLTAWITGHCHRFKAAVPEQGVYNMLSFWGTSDAGVALTELEMGGSPHKMPQQYWHYSPVAHAHKCKTPTLVIQGETDIRCPMEQAEQLYTALRQHGCVTEFIRLQKCNHGAQLGGRPSLRRYRMNALLDWFNTHIK